MITEIRIFFIVIIIFFTSMMVAFEATSKTTEKDTGLLLAKSFWGECGLDCSEKEKNIIYNIYKKRQVDWHLCDIILAYSGAVKKRKDHPKKWLHWLNRDGDKPNKWNKKLRWRNHKEQWLDMIDSADYLLENNPPDECPECVHYCGGFERYIAHKDLVKVKLGLKNVFWKWRK